MSTNEHLEELQLKIEDRLLSFSWTTRGDVATVKDLDPEVCCDPGNLPGSMAPQSSQTETEETQEEFQQRREIREQRRGTAPKRLDLSQRTVSEDAR
ncbi:hypothetical protein AGIG_G22570 [Arapaima gigas]